MKANGLLPKDLPSYIALAGGFLLMFSWTTLAPFEFISLIAALTTLFVMVQKKEFSWIWSELYNRIILFFALLVGVQMALLPSSDFTGSATTLYLIAVFFIAQYWFRKDQNILKSAVSGYILGAVISSLLGVGAYIARLIVPSSMKLPFFWGDDVRILGFFDDPVVYGAYLIPALILLFYFFLSYRKNERYTIILPSILFLFINLILSGSRGAWLSAIVAFIIVVLALKDVRAKIREVSLLSIAALIISSLIIFVIPIRYGKTFYDITLVNRLSVSDSPRLEGWSESPERSLKKPLHNIFFGSGTGSFEKGSERNLAAHNEYITLAYEQGIVGLLLWILFLGTLSRSLLKEKRMKREYAILLLAVIIGFAAQSFFTDTLHWRHFWLLIGLV